MEKVVFIHGMGGSSFDYYPIKKYLDKFGISSTLFSYKSKLGFVSIADLAKQFDKFSKKIKGKFILVGLSLGGIVGSYWLEFLGGNKKCKKLISVCSPFGGTYFGYSLPLGGLKQIRTESDFLKKLNSKIKKSEVKYYCVWNPIDSTVVPGKSAKLDGAINKKVTSVIHVSTFWNKETKDFVRDVILGKK